MPDVSARAAAVVAGALLLASCATNRGPVHASHGEGTTTSPLRRTGVNENLRAWLARARVEGWDSLSVAVIARDTGARAVDELAIQALGVNGRILARFDELGFLRVTLPADRVLAFVALPAVVDYAVGSLSGAPAIEVDGRVHVRTIRREPTASAQGNDAHLTPPGPAPGTELLPRISAELLARDPGYLAHDEVGADRLRTLVPLADGRGVTIGVVEGSLHYGHEAFREARSLSGESIPKVAGVINEQWFREAGAAVTRAGGGVAEAGAPRPGALVTADTTIVSNDGLVVVAGDTVRLPGPGSWRVAAWARPRVVSFWPRDGDTIRYVVAWRDTLGAWVDVDRDRDLRNDPFVPNINVRFGSGLFPADSSIGAAAARDFAVAFSADGEPYVFQPFNDHTTMVAGTAAGSRYLGGEKGGVAPGARLVLTHGFAVPDRFVRTVRDPRTDVITNQTSARQFPNESGSLMGLLFERLSAAYRKPLFISAGNSGPRGHTVSSSAAASGTLGVGVYVSHRSHWMNESWEVASGDNVAGYSSRGVAADGSFAPDLLAPSHVITSGACVPEPVTRGRARYILPECYMLGSGTSNSAPFAAGAAALLVSAGRLTRIRPELYDGPAISWALTATARHLEGIGVHEQGAGLIQIDSAWKVLQLSDRRATIISRGPVENAYAPFLAQEGRGPGIYVREGWTAGRSEVRQVTLTRTSGERAAKRYHLRWRGNDGTFGLAQSSVVLPLNRPVPVPVHIAPRAQGVHTAALEVVDPATRLPHQRVPVTVVAGLTLDATNGFTAQISDVLRWPGARSTFVHVPVGTAVLHVKVAARTGSALLRLQGPFGVRGPAVTRGPIVEVTPAQEALVVVADPVPGTWEVTLGPDEYSRALDGHDSSEDNPPGPGGQLLDYTLEAVAFFASAQAEGSGDLHAVTFSNRGAPITAAAVVASNGARRVASGTITPSATDTLQPLEAMSFTVDSGVTTLRVALKLRSAGSVSDRVHLRVYDCSTARGCSDEAPLFTDIGRQQILITTPRRGTWKIVVDPVRVRDGPIEYVVDVVTTHGESRTLRAPSGMEQGEVWEVVVPPTGDAAYPGPDGARVTVVDLLMTETQGAPLRTSPGEFLQMAGVVLPAR